MPSLHVDTVPVPQPRQRSAVIAGHIRNYTPATHPVNAFKAAVQLAFQQQAGRWVAADEPMWLRCLCVFGKPTSRVRKRDGGLRTRHATKPDIDNVLKAVLDSLTGLAWVNDSRVSQIDATKCYCAYNENPHVEIEFDRFTQQTSEVQNGRKH